MNRRLWDMDDQKILKFKMPLTIRLNTSRYYAPQIKEKCVPEME